MDAEKNIKNLVLSAISRNKNLGVSTSDYIWLLEIAVTFYQEQLRGFNMPSLRSEEIEINLANKIWYFPSDLIALTRVAYRDGNRLWNLTMDDSLNLLDTPTACELPTNNGQDTTENSLPFYYYDSNTRYGQGGGRNVNYYRVDHDNRRILFAESVPVGKGVIEYLSTGLEVGEDTFIPPAYAETFRRYLNWQIHENSSRREVYARSKDKERQYKEMLWDANILGKANMIQELYDELMKGSSFTLR